MIKTDLHTEWANLAKNLNAPGNLVDSRTVEDQLNFITHFAELINFYDKENKLNGNWKPFILKDPVFLTVQIAKTPWKKAYNQFVEFCNIAEDFHFKRTSIKDGVPVETDHARDFYQIIANIFEAIIAVYQNLEKWTENMAVTSGSNELKQYVFENIKKTYAPLFWGLVELTSELKLEKQSGVIIVGTERFAAFDQLIWTLNKNKQPYWQVLNTKRVKLLSKRPQELVETLRVAGENTFSFYRTVIEMARVDLKAIALEKSPFPDTLLLRSFVELLQNNRLETNVLTEKHLDFYYSGILKQKKLPAAADSVYVCATLSGKNAYDLPKGTTFTAGNNTDGSPLLFTSNNIQRLNPGRISAVQTLLLDQPKDRLEQLYLNVITTPNVIQKDEEGSVKGWNTFGAKNQTPEVIGIGFASPMLLLREGVRTIELTLNFSTLVSLDQFNKASFYLSTNAAWMDVSSKIQPPATPYPKSAVSWKLTLLLERSDPAIETFTKGPDGFQPQWPMFKMAFNGMDDLAEPPGLISLTISTTVSGIKSLILSNDNGALNAAKPFQPFGPIAEKENTFYIGNAEIFSKNLNFFNLELDWDKLESDFGSYYELYNKYLWGELVPTPDNSESKSIVTSIWDALKSLGTKVYNGIKKLLTKKESRNGEIVLPPTFFNQAFKVTFGLLVKNDWQSVTLERKRDCSTNKSTVTCEAPYTSDTESTALNLFNATKDNPDELVPTTFYSYNKTASEGDWPYNPAIQNQTNLNLSETTSSGFLKLTLDAPGPGFGNSVYPKVVSAVALINADEIVNTTKNGETPKLINAPNVPFIPTIKSITANYSASQDYTFDYALTDNPIQCYHYSAFENYLIYDSTAEASEYRHQIGSPIFGAKKIGAGLGVYPALNFDGVFMVEMTQVIAPNPISFFVELAESPFRKQEEEVSLSYFYLSKSGWEKLDVLTDETKDFTCSGTITFDFPDDWVDDNVEMPTAFWWGVGLNGDPGAIAQTVFFESNGFSLTRNGSDFEWNTEKPTLPANKITGPQKNIPEIAKTIQPFASFGGRGAEDKAAKNLRVSSRLKTKDRAVTADDYARIIQQNFDTVFYSKINFNARNRTIDIHLVKKVDDPFAANAFLPLVNKCLEESVTDCLVDRSGYDQISVKNFNLKYVTVNATVFIRPEFELKGTAKRITQALKVFLSPWIQSQSGQITIDQGISDVQVAQFLNDFYEVVSVEDIEFELSTRENGNLKRAGHKSTYVLPKNPSVLLVPDANQAINWKSAV